MISSAGTSSRVDFTPRSVEDVPEATLQARFALAAVKAQQDVARVQGEGVLRLLEPHKGGTVNARA